MLLGVRTIVLENRLTKFTQLKGLKQMLHESKWIAEKGCWRLVHPETGDFIAEYYPFTNQLVVTKHRKTATIKLDEYQVLKHE